MSVYPDEQGEHGRRNSGRRHGVSAAATACPNLRKSQSWHSDHDISYGGLKMFNRALAAIVLTLSLAACQSGGSSQGGITIPQSDGTPPAATLQVAVAASGGESAAVSTSAGNPQSMTLLTKAGALNLAASAKDSESGVQNLEIWMSARTTTCNASTCQVSGPLQGGPPLFSSTTPQKKPGETTAESSIILQSLDLTQKIPQKSPASGDTITVVLIFWVKAVNHLGDKVTTPRIEATYRESS